MAGFFLLYGYSLLVNCHVMTLIFHMVFGYEEFSFMDSLLWENFSYCNDFAWLHFA